MRRARPVLYSLIMRKPPLAAALLLALPLSAAAQGRQAAQSPTAELAEASLQAPGLEYGLSRVFDAARSGLSGASAVWIRPGAARLAAAPAQPAKPKLSVMARKMPDLVVPMPVVTPVYKHTFDVLLAHPQVTDRYDDLILKYAYKYHLDARLLKSVIAAESEFFIGAVSPRGAHGLMQVMPSTAREFGVSASDLLTPEGAIEAGSAYLAKLFEVAWQKYKLEGVRYHDVPLWLKQRIIAAYNAGPRFLFSSRFYPQTRSYVTKVLLFYRSHVTDVRRPSHPASEYPTLGLPESAAALN